MHRLAKAVGALRAPALATVLLLFIFTVPQQVHEVFRGLRESEGWLFAGEIIRTTAFLLIHIGVIFVTCSILIHSAPKYRRAAVKKHQDTLVAITISMCFAVVAGIIAAIIFGVEGYSGAEKQFRGFLSPAQVNDKGEWIGCKDFICTAQLSLAKTATLSRIVILVSAFAVLIAFWASLRTRLLNRTTIAVHEKFSNLTTKLTDTKSAALIFFVIALLSVVFAISPISASLIVGPVGILFLFATVFCVTTSWLGHIFDRWQFPAISLLLLAAVTWAYFPTNDNHTLRLLPQTSTKPYEARTAFWHWLSSRPDLPNSQDKPYVVYMVSLEGGGLYAAAHSAWVLAELQDRCEAFAERVFAISGVSGGSVGAALFTALLKSTPDNVAKDKDTSCDMASTKSGPLQHAVKEFFYSQDFLTPVLAMGLFPDFVQRFFPIGFPRLDRAYALESAIENAWVASKTKYLSSLSQTQGRDESNAGPNSENKEKSKGNIFSQSARMLWRPNENIPAVLFNTTLVHNGERVVIAPFKLLRRDFNGLHNLSFADRYVDILNEDTPVSLATAAIVSARFPFVTPPASFWHEGYQLPAQLADGGYYDNSGVLTLINLIDLLRRQVPDMLGKHQLADPNKIGANSCPRNNYIVVTVADNRDVTVCIKLITIRGRSSKQKDFYGGDYFSLIPAMYQARIARGKAGIELANRLHCGGENCGWGRAANNPHVYIKYLDIEGLQLPLGWYFSRSSLSKIFKDTSFDPNCRVGVDSSPEEDWPKTNSEAVSQENNCLRRRIMEDLK